MKSIRQQLLIWLITGMFVSVALAGVSMYWLAQDEANELFDAQIKQLATSLPNHLNIITIHNTDEDPEENSVVQIWNLRGELRFATHPTHTFPRYPQTDVHTVEFQGQQWRIYGAYHRGQYVQVAQPMTVREELAVGLAVRMLIPFAVLIPILAGMIWLVVGRSLRPLQTVTNAVTERHADAMQALDETDLPLEILPLVVALNQLLARLNLAIAAQRAFVADAAHELRSPLTALKLQLQLTERAVSDEQRAIAFNKLHQRLDRSTHLVQQLLVLARSEPPVASIAMRDVDLSELAHTVAQDYAEQAVARNIAMQLDIQPHVITAGVSADLYILISNLVDNALRYTPADGNVRLRVTSEGGVPILRVIDTGMGIPVADRERVFDRFYRIMGTATTGSGLGLAIVHNIATAHQAKINLEDNPVESGLMVVVQFAKVATDIYAEQQ
ncbi:MAG: two-component sensor histidine kinase [Sulfuriferula sp.]|nr:two-component sensor histidine kinase [Sulfuriferula sp.]